MFNTNQSWLQEYLADEDILTRRYAHGLARMAGIYRCPADLAPRYIDYGLSAWFEAAPPWNRVTGIPHPSATICFCEIDSTVQTDHVMPWEWEQASDPWMNDIVRPFRHQQLSHYVYVDGHVVRQTIISTFGPACSLNLWNPKLAP